MRMEKSTHDTEKKERRECAKWPNCERSEIRFILQVSEDFRGSNPRTLVYPFVIKALSNREHALVLYIVRRSLAAKKHDLQTHYSAYIQPCSAQRLPSKGQSNQNLLLKKMCQ
jgi:hypothetical protein